MLSDEALLDKAERRYDLALALYQEFNEKLRHYVNVCVAILGLDIALKSIISIAYMDVLAIPLILK